MQRCKITILILLMFLFASSFQSLLAAEIKGIRLWQDPEKTRVVLDLTGKVEYKVFTLSNPSRLVIDLKAFELKVLLEKVELPPKLVKDIRSSRHSKFLRIVMDLSNSVSSKSFTLKPYQKFGHRLVVDLRPKGSKKKVVKRAASQMMNKNRDVVVVIDAGHGGEDPGAPGGEKQVCLAVAKRLATLINKQKGMKSVLTRSGDYYVGLRKRTEIARKNKADLFISLHADGFHDKKVRGTAVWILSPKGASSEMGRWLENQEEASDLAGGVDISHQDPLVAKVIIDLSMNHSVGESVKAAEVVRQQLAKSMPKMHGKTIKKAAFVVLKMPDIPSMMVEMGYISNKKENKLLKSTKHQKKIASSIFKGVKNYFRKSPPAGSLYASLAKMKSYRVKSGDTLSEIAQRHGTSLQELRNYNQLKNDRLRVGQVIQIPGV
ncbi:MAG: N-acetylmuramoyl-L-alanine amidase [Enterobacterales bacterium]|nr:N-acetylmuramoyl-L-alanine amidase [Enterobacterales bacterium]